MNWTLQRDCLRARRCSLKLKFVNNDPSKMSAVKYGSICLTRFSKIVVKRAHIFWHYITSNCFVLNTLGLISLKRLKDKFCSLNFILLLKSGLVNMKTAHNSVLTKHWHWCLMEIVSSVIMQWLFRFFEKLGNII